uniref:Uncharacterized protein n=1 Tax=Oryza glumipatula TaxID=40148 RepID=A0A0E0AUM4_9ORYZ
MQSSHRSDEGAYQESSRQYISRVDGFPREGEGQLRRWRPAGSCRDPRVGEVERIGRRGKGMFVV